MNILFFTSYKPSANTGGTERATITLAKSLKQYYGWDCYATYIVEDGKEKEECFIKICKLDEKKAIHQIEKIINKWEIDCFIDQGDFWIASSINRNKFGRKCKIILAYHFEPGWDINFFSPKNLLECIKKDPLKQKIKAMIKLILYDVYFRQRYKKKLQKYCNRSYHNVDSVVLLVKAYQEAYASWARLEMDERSKFFFIPNALSYDHDYDIKNITEKQHGVLIVSRLDEKQKRISLALNIWKKIKENPITDTWKLQLIGTGEDEAYYKSIVSTNQIPDVIFYGRQEPRLFYEKSSIFLMTSKSEGWGLTISEAQQFGVVPIAYDTALSFREMIVNEENGILIDEGDEKKFCDKLLRLMSDDDYRYKLAKNAIESSVRFDPMTIAAKWKSIISDEM